MLGLLKTFWREYVRLKENEEAFFHGCSYLTQTKHYHRLYRSLGFGKGEILYYSQAKKRLYLKVDTSVIVSTDAYYDIFLEIFVNKIYLLPPQLSMKKFVVFDAGMNRGYASLYFANMENCEHVYGFELDSFTYEWACENINLNSRLTDKISAFNFGLWDKDDEVDIVSDGIDGHTQISADSGDKQALVKGEVKESSSVFSKLFQSVDKSLLKILKIDVEGAEYDIFANLYKHGLLKEFDLIVGEYHKGLESLLKYLSDFNCSYQETFTKGSIGTMVFMNKKYGFF